MVSPLRGLSFLRRASQLIRGVLRTPPDWTTTRSWLHGLARPSVSWYWTRAAARIASLVLRGNGRPWEQSALPGTVLGSGSKPCESSEQVAAMNWAQNKPFEQTNGTPPRTMAPFAAQRQRSPDMTMGVIYGA